jgi:hypothetical protein
MAKEAQKFSSHGYPQLMPFLCIENTSRNSVFEAAIFSGQQYVQS